MIDKHRSPRKTALSAALSAALGAASTLSPAVSQAVIVDFSWQGLLTFVDPAGNPLSNTSPPYHYDQTWGYGVRTQISGTLQFDTATSSGTAQILPFGFLIGSTPATVKDLRFSSAGGPLLIGNLLADWNGNYNMPASIVWDAQGLFDAAGTGLSPGAIVTGTGALPATNAARKGLFPIGPSPIATTGYDTTPACIPANPNDCLGINPIGTLPLIADSVGGSPMLDGPFPGLGLNFDITTLQVNSVSAVPIPPALWLFSAGTLGLLGIARRRRPGGTATTQPV